MELSSVRALPTSSLERMDIQLRTFNVLELMKKAESGNLIPCEVKPANPGLTTSWASNNHGSLRPHLSIRAAESALLRIPLPRITLVFYQAKMYAEDCASLLRNLFWYINPQLVGQKEDSPAYKQLLKLMEFDHDFGEWSSLPPRFQTRILETELSATYIRISDDFFDAEGNLEALHNVTSRTQGNWP